MRLIDAVRETIVDVSCASPSTEHFLAARPLPGGHFRNARTVGGDESTGDRGGERTNQGNPGYQQKVVRSDKRRIDRGRDPQRPLGGFNTKLTVGKSVVLSCRQNHPPWICKEFRLLPVSERKRTIAKSKRCFGCLAAGHRQR